VRSAVVKHGNFFGNAGAPPFRKKPFASRQSLFAIRYPLPSRPADLPTSRLADKFGSALASPSHFVPVPRPTPLVPLKFGAKVFRHQLRVKTRSMNGFGCIINYGLKFVAWMTYFALTKIK